MKYEAGFIGCGNMGGTLAAVAAGRLGGDKVICAEHNREKLKGLEENFGVAVGDSRAAAAGSRYIVLGVKPQVMRNTADEIRDILAKRTDRFTVVTMAAGISMSDISEMLGSCPVIRIMPNTPASVGEAMIPYCVNELVTQEDEEGFLDFLGPAGILDKLDENKIDTACAVSGCGPAFVCLFIEALVDGAVECGLTRDKARLYAIQTLYGTAKLIMESGRSVSELRDAVCSPGGSTIVALASMERRAFRSVMIDAVEAAYNKTKALGGKN